MSDDWLSNVESTLEETETEEKSRMRSLSPIPSYCTCSMAVQWVLLGKGKEDFFIRKLNTLF